MILRRPRRWYRGQRRGDPQGIGAYGAGAGAAVAGAMYGFDRFVKNQFGKRSGTAFQNMPDLQRTAKGHRFPRIARASDVQNMEGVKAAPKKSFRNMAYGRKRRYKRNKRTKRGGRKGRRFNKKRGGRKIYPAIKRYVAKAVVQTPVFSHVEKVGETDTLASAFNKCK